jgi:ABC-2 type transport system permease protein
MLNNVFMKTLRDWRRSLLFWGVGILAFMVMIVSFYPAIRNSQQIIQQYVNMLPKNLISAFAGDITDYGTPAGFLNTELFFFMLPMLILVFTIGFGSGAIAGEEENGTLGLLLSFPLTRRRLVLEKAGALVVITIILTLVLWAGLVIGKYIINMNISLGNLAAACFSTALLGIVFGMFALALGCAMGKKSMAIAVAGAVAVLFYFVNALASNVGILKYFQKLSPFYYYTGNKPLVNGLSALDVGVMLAIIVVLTALAVLGFRRRDVSV